jgi:tRNA acetyltransferase TAN1
MWVTYVRGCETRAIDELSKICESYSRSLWPDASIDSPPSQRLRPDQSEVDIETCIEDEIKAMKNCQAMGRSTGIAKRIRAIPSAMECVLFMETKSPIIPLDLVMAICSDCSEESNTHLDNMCRYVSRITPTSIMGKATVNGMSRIARDVLSQHFDMAPEADHTNLESTDDIEAAQSHISSNIHDIPVRSAGNASDSDRVGKIGSTYAIRTSIRHSNLTSNEVITHLAATISNRHRVDLVAPEKVILVEIYQMLCGMVVVDGAIYKALKRFNVNEIRKH